MIIKSQVNSEARYYLQRHTHFLYILHALLSASPRQSPPRLQPTLCFRDFPNRRVFHTWGFPFRSECSRRCFPACLGLSGRTFPIFRRSSAKTHTCTASIEAYVFKNVSAFGEGPEIWIAKFCGASGNQCYNWAVQLNCAVKAVWFGNKTDF
jgi:hypothetical protein